MNMLTNPHVELTKMLSEDLASVQKRSNHTFDPAEDKIRKNGILLFGSGLFGKRILRGLRKMGIEPLGFVDNNERIWGTHKEGLEVFSPETAVYSFPKATYMVTIWSDIIGHPIEEIEKQLIKFNKVEVISFFFLFWKYPDLFLPYFSIDSPDKTIKEAKQIIECFSLFNDEISKKEFLAQIKWRLEGDFTGLTPPGKYTQYFYDDLFQLNKNEVFVDCGAFDGDTMRNFLRKQEDEFFQYIALEPDPINFEKLQKFVSELPQSINKKIKVEQYAVSDKKKVLNFESNGSLQSVISDSGNIQVNCISIDEYFVDSPVTYIKMDTEGSEPEIIDGASNVIKKNFPILAISVYHHYNHLWKLPLAVNAIGEGYSFFLRPHCFASWDLICYAIPKHRLVKNNS